MALETVTLNPGTGGEDIAVDTVGSAQVPVSKILLGADSVDGGLVSSANPLPVSDAGGSITVDGTVAVSGSVDITDGGGSMTVDGTVELGATSLAALESVNAAVSGSLTVSGSVTANAGTNLNTSALALEAGGNLAAAAASLALLDNAIAGTEMQVDVLTLPNVTIGAAIPAGNNNIGDVDVASIAAGDNNIGNVDIVTMPSVTVNALPAGSNNIGDVDVLTLPPVTNAGTFVVQVDGAALTSLQLIDDPVIADDAAFTPATSKVMMSGFEADETATDSIDEGDAGAARMTLDRKLIVTPQPHSAGGLSIFRSIDLDEGALEVVKNSPGCVYGMWVTNQATSTRWVKFYDATSGTVGTGTPVITIGIPGNSSDDISGNFGPGGMGIGFTTGICVGASTGVADADTGAPGANDVICNIFYK